VVGAVPEVGFRIDGADDVRRDVEPVDLRQVRSTTSAKVGTRS
jgi:hypothetical protein